MTPEQRRGRKLVVILVLATAGWVAIALLGWLAAATLDWIFA